MMRVTRQLGPSWGPMPVRGRAGHCRATVRQGRAVGRPFLGKVRHAKPRVLPGRNLRPGDPRPTRRVSEFESWDTCWLSVRPCRGR